MQGIAVARSEAGFMLTSSDGALPLLAKEDDALLPLVGLEGLDAFGLWDGRQFDLKYAETPLGRWVGAAA